MSKLNLTVDHWAAVKPDAFLTGSIVQARNVLEMATQDIALLAAERDRIERNREMWKGQVERQAEQLTKLHGAVAAYLSFLRRSVNVGPLTNNPTKEAALLRTLMDLTAPTTEVTPHHGGAHE